MSNKLFYKYRPFNKYTDDIILNAELYFSSPLTFNDPFDCTLSYRKFYTEFEVKNTYINLFEKYFLHKDILHKKLGPNYINFFKLHLFHLNNMQKNMGILSLSKINNNITMWSHYSNNHNGLVFEFNEKKDFYLFKNLIGVNYLKKEEYSLFSFSKPALEEFARLVTSKYKDWKYEEEVRIVDFKKNGNKKFNKMALNKIYFGCNADEDNIKRIIQLCNTNGFEHVLFQKAERIEGKFAIDFNDIDKEKYLN